MTAAIRQTIASLRQERERLSNVGPAGVEGEMAGLPGAHAVLRASTGATPGSFLDERITAMIESGKSANTLTWYVRTASVIAASVAVGAITGGAGAGVALVLLGGGSAAAVAGLPGFAQALSEVDRARARVASGAGATGDVDAAEWNRGVAGASYAAGILVPGVASHVVKTAGIVHGALAERTLEAMVAFVIEKSGHAAERSGKDALILSGVQRANFEAAQRALAKMSSTQRAALNATLDRTLDAAGLRGSGSVQMQERAAVLTAFVLDHGGDLGSMTPGDAANKLARWIRSHRAR